MNLNLALLLLFGSLVFIIYFIFPKKYRYLVLLIASYALFITISKWLVVFLFITTLSIYIVGLIINKYNDQFQLEKEGKEKEERKALKAKYNKKKKIVMALGVIFNVLTIVILKYLNLFGEIFNGFFNLFHINYSIPTLFVLVPLGISYYTLNAISYIVDVYRGKFKGDKNFLNVMLFMSYFPTILEGPFHSYDKLEPQLKEGHSFDYTNMTHGLQLVLFGMFKKMVVADRINIITSEVFANYGDYSSGIIILTIVLYTIQLYTEFSGIIEMVQGVSEMFGIKLNKNFDKPFFSKSVAEFWRRWHMSLGNWLKEYIFYPVSLNSSKKVSKTLTEKGHNFLSIFIPEALGLFCVWTICGIWHGPTVKYFIYGMYYYVIMIFGILIQELCKKFKGYEELKTKKWYIAFQIIRTFILVNIGIMLFRAETLTDFYKMFLQIFKTGGIGNIVKSELIDVPELVVMAVSITFLILVEFLHIYSENIRDEIDKKNIVLRWSLYLALALAILYFGTYGPSYKPVDPIYGKF
ncbi:MAG: hypothetical protein K6E20_03600 [Acholeplasmatales bacterium]|nr:hypothetical protein [Acholeplasmatales bacterium]